MIDATEGRTAPERTGPAASRAGRLDACRLRLHTETDMVAAMRVVTDQDHEAAQGRRVPDVHEQNPGCDLTSPDPESGEPRLIAVKGLAAPGGVILLPPNDHCVAEERAGRCRRQVVTNGGDDPESEEPTPNPARFPRERAGRSASASGTLETTTRRAYAVSSSVLPS